MTSMMDMTANLSRIGSEIQSGHYARNPTNGPGNIESNFTLAIFRASRRIWPRKSTEAGRFTCAEDTIVERKFQGREVTVLAQASLYPMHSQ